MLFSLIDGLERIPIILASLSPRRYELLRRLGLQFEVVQSHGKEEQTYRNPIEEVAIRNARQKGMDVARRYPDALVICADTIVVHDKQILGKPGSEEEAFDMLQKLSGNVHQVYTGLGLIWEKYNASVFDSLCTNVAFRNLTDEEIWAYINTGEPFDKAGGYGIQEQGALLVEKIDGCYYNVVGFPLTRFYTILMDFLRHFVI